MLQVYGIRSTFATPFSHIRATDDGLADFPLFREERRVFTSERFLEDALVRAGSKAELGRILDLPSSRIADFWKAPGKGKRTLSMEEGVRLARALKMVPFPAVSEEQLIPVLQICLRHRPGNWSDQDVASLAQEIALGLELQEALRTNRQEPNHNGDETGATPQARDKRA